MRMLRGGVSRTIGLVTALAAVCAPAQTHKVGKPEQVVRAVGVYEWTGDLAKPTGSRLIPVTVFIDGQLQDAGVYLARPVPFALLSGNFYELQQAGLSRGGLELSFAKHLQAVDTATGATEFDDGWFGYGSFKAPAAPKKAPALVTSKTVSEIKTSKDDDGKPHFSNKSGSDSGASGTETTTTGGSDSSAAPSGGSTSAGDPDRPTMRRRTGSDTSTGSSSGSSAGKSSSPDTSTPADDPDRPRLSKKTGTDSGTPDAQGAGDPDATASGSNAGSGSGQSGSTGNVGSGSGSTTTAGSGGSADDPDRPTLKRRTPEEIKKQNQKEASASVRGVGGSLNDDPDRPTLHYGKPASSMTEKDLPKLTGLPADLHQMVAVSDAADRTAHDFTRPWEDDAERANVLLKMQTLARAKLKEYMATTGSAAGGPGAQPAKSAAPARPATAAAAAAARRKAAAAPPPPPIELQEESLKGYTLSYGGAATYVYTAHTPGAGATLDYVTVVAQADPQGELKVAIQSVTDAAHLDRTPRMRLVDAVDVEASNRASLLFELRGARSRQFGVYRVIGARADQTFATGTTQ